MGSQPQLLSYTVIFLGKELEFYDTTNRLVYKSRDNVVRTHTCPHPHNIIVVKLLL